MNLLLIAGAFLAMTAPEDPEIHNVTLRGERVAVAAVVCRNQWGTAMLPYGNNSAPLDPDQALQDQNSVIRDVELAMGEILAKIRPVQDKINAIVLKQDSNKTGAGETAAKLEAVIEKQAALTKKQSQVLKPEGEFQIGSGADKTQLADEKAKLEADLLASQAEQQKLAKEAEQLTMDARGYKEQLAPLQTEIDPLNVELAKIKELKARLKNPQGYSLLSPSDLDFIERSLLQPPKGDDSRTFGVSNTREFDRVRSPRNGSRLTPYRPPNIKVGAT